MAKLSKLQIRAKVLACVSEIKLLSSLDEVKYNQIIKELSEIDDTQSLLDIFIKEFIKMDEQEYTLAACIIKEVIPLQIISDKVFEYLKSSSYNDESKYKLVQLLRIAGETTNYDDIPKYFDNPEEVLDIETKKLLNSAVFNPESMLDFLDFIYAVNYKDRDILLKSLCLDYTGDILANILYPVLYSDFEDSFLLQIISVLSDSKSSLALAPFEYLIKTSDNIEIVKACKNGLKKLKFSGASEQIAQEYFKNIVKNSKPYKFYVTIPDGNGNQALLISRILEDNNCSLSAVVINDKLGVIDCFGFYNISDEELTKIINRFNSDDGKYIVSPEYVKSKINFAIDKTIEKKRKFPYEFICWNPMLSDIGTLNFSFKDFSKENFKIHQISKQTVLEFLTNDYLNKWFITPSENDVLNSIVEDIYNLEEFDINNINDRLLNEYDKVFDDETTSIWKNKIYDLVYLLKTNNMIEDADIIYNMLENKEHFRTFKLVIIQKSVFNHFIALICKTKELSKTANIFSKKGTQDNIYDIQKLEFIVHNLDKNWINE